jgi:hypothetical protein
LVSKRDQVNYLEAIAVLMVFLSNKSRIHFMESSPFGVAILWGPNRWKLHDLCLQMGPFQK